MPLMTVQQRIGRRGALLAVVMGAGFGCAEIINADFDKPFQAGGTGGDMPSASSGGAGGSTPAASSSESSGAMSSSSSSESSGAMSSSSSSGSSGAGGDPCMLNGTCATKTIYVALENPDGQCGSDAQDVLMGDNSSIANNNFRLISQFEVFTSPSPNTIVLNICTTGAGKKTNNATLDNEPPCKTGGPNVTTLGHVSKTKAIPAYEQLKRVTAGSTSNALVLETALDGKSCCFAKSSCTAVNAYVPE